MHKLLVVSFGLLFLQFSASKSTTKFTYKYYDVYTARHEGMFPRLYWTSESIPLYGCDGVSANLRIYPLGDTKEANGHVSAYIHFLSNKPSRTLEGTFSVSIYGKTSAWANQSYLVCQTGCADTFGKGSGWATFSEMDAIFKEPNTTLKFIVAVDKMTERNGNRETFTHPAGEQEHVSTCEQDPNQYLQGRGRGNLYQGGGFNHWDN